MITEQLPTPVEEAAKTERTLGIWIASVLFTFQIVATGVIYYLAFRNPDVFADVLREHFICILGFPMAVMTALVIVVIFRVAAGPIEFKTPFGFEFKGASGPVILWVFAFLANITGAVALWNLRK
jgi:hypothetical protein